MDVACFFFCALVFDKPAELGWDVCAPALAEVDVGPWDWVRVSFLGAP